MGVFGSIGRVLSTVAPIAGSFLGPAGAIAGGAVGALGSSLSTEDDRHYAEQLQQKTNEYNLPSNQAKRFAAAGFNPALALGSGVFTPGNASTTPPVQGATDPNQLISSVASMMNAVSARRHTESDISKQSVESDLFKKQMEQIGVQMDKTDAERALLDLQSENQRIENSLLHRYGDSKAVSEINERVSQALLNNENVVLTARNVDAVASQILKNYAEAHNMNVESSKIQAMLPYVIANLKAQTAGIVYDNAFKDEEQRFRNTPFINGVARYPTNFGNQMRMAHLQLNLKNASLAGKQNRWFDISKIAELIGTAAGAVQHSSAPVIGAASLGF